MQSLREQEERIAREEEEEEAMFLTYDRPEMVNKVVFRRRHSGTWEVCPPGEATSLPRNNITSKAGATVNHVSKGKHSPSTACHGINSTSPEFKVNISLSASTGRSSSKRKCKKNSKVEDPVLSPDPDYKPGTRQEKTGRKAAQRVQLNSNSRTGMGTKLLHSNEAKENHVNVGIRSRLRQHQSNPAVMNNDATATPSRRYPTRNRH